jgi:hypothetical protein
MVQFANTPIFSGLMVAISIYMIQSIRPDTGAGSA